MRVVMYHYVRNFDPKRPALRFLHIDDFRAQLDHFQEEYGFVTRTQWDHALATRSSASLQGKVLLTFDDALSCSYEFVFPELRKRDLWGMFFVPSGPYETGSLLNVHKIHLLCASLPTTQLDDLIQATVREEHIPFEKRDEFRKETYVTQRDKASILRFKRCLNYFVDEACRSELLDKMAQAAKLSFPSVDEYYMTRPQLQEMARGGMIIGGHSVAHRVMSKLSVSEQRAEIAGSIDFLNRLGIPSPRVYCHPYGGCHTYTDDTLDLLDSLGFECSFDVRPEEINDNDLERQRQALPRFDCNAFPFGSAFCVEGQAQAS